MSDTITVELERYPDIESDFKFFVCFSETDDRPYETVRVQLTDEAVGELLFSIEVDADLLRDILEEVDKEKGGKVFFTFDGNASSWIIGAVSDTE